MNKLPKPDLNYVISTPLTTGLLALFGKNKHKTPYIFEVGDLWPEAPIQLGVLRNPILIWMARKLERKVYNHAKHIVALSPDIANVISDSTLTPVTTITNIADTSYFKPNLNSKLKRELGYENKFMVGYIGTVGLANNLEYLLDAAEACKESSKVGFFIMGGGAQYQSVKQKAKEKGLKNIDFYSEANKEKARDMLNIADAIYVSFANAPILASGSPNKFFDGLANGKLIIINFKGWIKKLVEENECGFYYDPLKPISFIEKLKPFLDDDEKIEKAKESSIRLAETYSMDRQFGKLIKALKTGEV